MSKVEYMYGLTKNLELVRFYLCKCEKCIERGMYECQIEYMNGDYYDCVRLDRLNEVLIYTSTNEYMVKVISVKRLKQLNKKEFEKLMSILKGFYNYYDELEKLKKAYKELEENFIILEKNYDKLHDMVYYPKPYKFEDLKPNMWVFDQKNKSCKKIIGIYDNKDNLKLIEFNDWHTFEFEENRFYSLTKAICEVNER